MSKGVSLTATADMLDRARSGDEQARCDLVQRYREPLARFLHARLALSLRGVHETADLGELENRRIAVPAVVPVAA